MHFTLAFIDFFIPEQVFGFGILGVDSCDDFIHRYLFSIYWNDGEISIDLFWFKIFTF